MTLFLLSGKDGTETPGFTANSLRDESKRTNRKEMEGGDKMIRLRGVHMKQSKTKRQGHKSGLVSKHQMM